MLKYLRKSFIFRDKLIRIYYLVISDLLQVAAELGKALVSQNKELENIIRLQKHTIEEQSHEIEVCYQNKKFRTFIGPQYYFLNLEKSELCTSRIRIQRKIIKSFSNIQNM